MWFAALHHLRAEVNHWWWFVGKWRGGWLVNKGMLYLSVVFESSWLKIDECIEYIKKRRKNCGVLRLAVLRGRHLIDGFVQQCEQKQSMTKQNRGGFSHCATWVSCVMEREAYTWGPCMIKTQVRGLQKVHSKDESWKNFEINTHFLVSIHGSAWGLIIWQRCVRSLIQYTWRAGDRHLKTDMHWISANIIHNAEFSSTKWLKAVMVAVLSVRTMRLPRVPENFNTADEEPV